MKLNKRLLEMGYTPKEFRKVLLGQFYSNTIFEINEIATDSWSIENTVALISIEISIEVAPPRKIAMLTMPVLNTEITFKKITETQLEEFMKTFFKYFHKGGG